MKLSDTFLQIAGENIRFPLLPAPKKIIEYYGYSFFLPNLAIRNYLVLVESAP
jgi:hypothetical protein